MAEVWFYHLEREPLQTVLVKILNGLAAKNIVTSVHFASEQLRDIISQDLWSQEDTVFLVHGVDGDPFLDRQPLFLTTGQEAENRATFRFFVQGVLPSGMDGIERASILFDGNDSEAVSAARTAWKTFKGQGLVIKYWRQNEAGRWQDQAAA